MTDGQIKICPKKDLTGKTFEKLTVLRQGPDYIANSGKRYTCWWCKCSCGNPDEVLVRGSSLVNGHVTSCGCRAHEVIDLTGQIFGRLTVLRRADDIIYNDIHYTAWWCKCSCGNSEEVLARSKDLKEGLKQSCGCMTKERLKKYNKYNLTGSYGIGWTNNDEEFYFDIKDFDLIKNFCWYYDNHGYLIAKSGKKHIRISRYLMGVLDEDGTQIYVDHKNGDTRDNRRENLRIVTPSQNAMNSKLRSNNTSGCSGIYKYGNKWLTMIFFNNERIFLGYYDTYEDAVKVRKEAEEKYFGEYSYDNSRGIKEGVD